MRYLFSLVYNDKRTLTGISASKIAGDCQVERENLNYRQAKNIKYFSPPPGEMWRISFLGELLEIRNGNIQVPGVSCEDIEEIIDEICIHRVCHSPLFVENIFAKCFIWCSISKCNLGT